MTYWNGDGDPIELGQNPTLGKPFAPISPAHQQAMNDVENTIDAFARGEQCSPLSIRGPFRTGKTALQYHTFEYAWKMGLPAVFVEASTLLDEYDPAKAASFDTWVYQRMQEEANAIVDRDLDAIEWLPSVAGSGITQQEWIDSNVPEDINTERGILLIDEVEQEYTEFISATGVDDDNPLRKLLDRPEIVTVLSMGQLSAFEFIGDADLGRMEPISIPPVTVEHTEDLLVEHSADPSLGRIAYWLTRGRAARVHQVVTEASKQSLSPSNYSEIADWLSDYAHQQSSEFQPVRQVWEDRILMIQRQQPVRLLSTPTAIRIGLSRTNGGSPLQTWYRQLSKCLLRQHRLPAATRIPLIFRKLVGSSDRRLSG